MKIISKIKNIALLGLAMGVAFSCSDDDDNDDDGIIDVDTSIVLTVIADDDLDNLEAALIAADLVDDLEDGTFTVLAPTDEAFQDFLDDNDFNSLSDIPQETLRQVLLNHVISGSVPASTLLTNGSGYAKTLSDAGADDELLSIFYASDSDDNITFNGAAEVTVPNIAATNGIIHKVDAVIPLPSVATFVSLDSNLGSLAAALTSAELVGTFDNDESTDALDGTEAPFTVFAPVESAFQALLDSNDEWNTLADIPAETVSAVLALHAINSNNIDSSELTDDDVETLGGTVSITASPATVQGPGNTTASTVIAADIQATNGIVHTIDQVLLPE